MVLEKPVVMGTFLIGEKERKELMNKKKEENRSGIRYGIQIMCAGYLAYLAIGMLKDGIIGGGVKGGARPIYLAASIAFLAFAALTAFLAIRDMVVKKGQQEADETAADADTEKEEIVENPVKMSERVSENKEDSKKCENLN